MSRVSVTYDNQIAHVRLTRADKMNAVDQDMIDAVIAAGNEVAASNARAVVISGEGKAFCAGIDIGGMGALADGDPTELGGRAIAYLVLAGVPLALAVKTFRAFLPVLTLLFRASLALGGVVALTAIYDAYMVSRTPLPPSTHPRALAPPHSSSRGVRTLRNRDDTHGVVTMCGHNVLCGCRHCRRLARRWHRSQSL